MKLPEKQHFSLEEISECWDIILRDIYYYIENDFLEVCVWFEDISIEEGDIEYLPHSQERCYMTTGSRYYTGYHPICASDCRIIFREEKTYISILKPATAAQFIRLYNRPSLLVKKSDLMISKKERERFEEKYQIEACSTPNESTSTPFIVLNDYRKVQCGNLKFDFGEKQALAVKLLHKVSQTDTPWLSGKEILEQIDSSCRKISELFKSQSQWREIIHSDMKGMYRLNTSME